MKHKEIILGKDYKLVSAKYSNPAEASDCFNKLIGTKVQVLEKYSNIHNKNTIRIEAITEDSIIEMWCSPYDLGGLD